MSLSSVQIAGARDRIVLLIVRRIDVGAQLLLRNAGCGLDGEDMLRRKVLSLAHPTPNRALRNAEYPTKRRLRASDLHRCTQSLRRGRISMHVHLAT